MSIKSRNKKNGHADIGSTANELHFCRARCDALLNNITEAYFENDLKSIITFVNESGCRLLGKTEDELLGSEFSRHLHPDTSRQMVEVYSTIYSSGMPFRKNDYKLLMPDGSYQTHELIAGLIRNQHGKPAGFFSMVKDVTDELKNREIEKTREERYRHILDSIEESYFEVDLKGNLLFFNNTVLKDLGYTSEEMETVNFRQLVDSDNAERVYDAFHRVFLTGDSIKGFEWTVIKKNGETIPVEGSIALNRDKDGNPAGFRGVVRDISERIKNEQAVRETVDKYISIIETMEESYFEEDLKGRLTFFNEALVRDLGYTREELTGMSYHQYLSPEVARRAEEFCNQIYNTGKAQHISNYEITRKDGTIATTELFTSLIRNKDGKPVGFWGVGRNVTEQLKSERALKESERRYRMITENVHDVIWTMDLDLKLTYLSPSVYRVFGFKPEELIGIKLIDYLEPDTREKITKLVDEERNRIHSGSNEESYISTPYEVEMKRKDGSSLIAEVTTSYIRDENNLITGILGITRDITERKFAEEEKTKLEAQLLQSQKMESVGRLAGGIAHDFNNMLSVIIGYAELIKLQMPRNDPLYKDILEIEKASMRSRDITSQLLAFSRKQVISPKVIDLNMQIDSVRKTLARLLGEDLELKFIKTDDLWAVRIDPSQVEQILINLAVNARDAMKNGGLLTIETRNTVIDTAYCRDKVGVSPGDYVELIVSDTGSGIDKRALPHIFEPFFTTKETGKGTGLGLATVYGIVNQNGGFINVYSEPEFGTTFRIYIPKTMEGVELHQAPEDQILSDTGNVLLVEDDAMVRRMVRDMLETIGYSVTAADSPFDALEYFEENSGSVDLVITDVIMPQMNGRELCDNLLKIKPKLKVLFMSGYTADSIVHHGVMESGTYFLQKPFSMKDLSVKMREAISGN